MELNTMLRCLRAYYLVRQLNNELGKLKYHCYCESVSGCVGLWDIIVKVGNFKLCSVLLTSQALNAPDVFEVTLRDVYYHIREALFEMERNVNEQCEKLSVTSKTC